MRQCLGIHRAWKADLAAVREADLDRLAELRLSRARRCRAWTRLRDAGVAVIVVTGSIAILTPPSRTSSSPCWYSRRHANTWLALTSYLRAITATEVPGVSVSSTIRRFSSIERRCRAPPRRPIESVVITSLNVSTYFYVDTYCVLD